jgi:aldehyde dehydrogenase (NAD+)
MSAHSPLFQQLGLPTGGPIAELGGVSGEPGKGPIATSFDPTTGEAIATLRTADRAEYDRVLVRAQQTFASYRMVPAPMRGQLVRRLGELIREHKEALGELISLEVGKIRSEGLGEVQEMVDICEFAVGLSRQLHGLTIASERNRHRMMEQWHPLGPIGVVTAFNFPMAVWAWNAALAAVCGDPVIWKPSPHAPLCAIAVQALADRAMKETGQLGVFQLVCGGSEPSEWMAEDGRLPLVSFTGSSRVGKQVAAKVAGRLGRSLLELGGNNAIIVLDDADLSMAVRAITFGAVGTAGQRCTSTRRLFATPKASKALEASLVAAYGSVKIGDPRAAGVLMGPLITEAAVKQFEATVAEAKKQGGEVLCGGQRVDRPGHFVQPTIIKAKNHDSFPIAHEETFAPILYLFEVDDVSRAIADQNAVTQGLSSAIFTSNLRHAEAFLSPEGSDCGIANVNLGTSGAEIGGAFGGEKDTGGGRESGSDAWKTYMRRQTSTVNYGSDLPLAQGVEFL